MCSTVRERIDLYVSGDLTPDEARKVEEHLARGDSCSREAAAYRARLHDLSLLSSDEQPDRLPPFFWQGIQKAILVGDEPKRKQPFITRPVVLAVAAAVLLAVTAFLILSPRGSSPTAGSGGLAGDPGTTAGYEQELELRGRMLPLVEQQGDRMPAAMPEERTFEF